MLQQQGSLTQQWFLPSADSSWWWNGNETQIKTIVPSNVLPIQPLLIQIQTSEAQNEAKWITPAPPP